MIHKESNILTDCYCEIKTSRRYTCMTADVLVLKTDEETTVIILKDFDAKFYPTVFIINNGNLDSTLVIKGRFRNTRLGRYKISISPIQ